MTKKRFTIIYGIDENPFEWDLMDNEKDALICQCNGRPICDLLNELNDENKQLQNKKERYKRLSKIRQQEINNRILTIKEFIDNCSDNKVKSVLEELFYSEVNEYDLSLENRKLLNENEQLKQELESFKPIIFESDGKPVTLYKKGDVE